MSKIEDNSFKIKSKDEILMDHVCKFFKDVNNTQKITLKKKKKKKKKKMINQYLFI